MKKLRCLYVPAEQANNLIKYFLKLCAHDQSIFNKVAKVIIRNKLQKKYNIIIGDRCTIGNGISFPHPQNIVIGQRVAIGINCTIYQDVTIGQKNGKYPKIGNNVIIYPGAKIFGDIEIGNNSVIGANSVVCKSFPDYSVGAGIPAIVVGEYKDGKYY